MSQTPSPIALLLLVAACAASSEPAPDPLVLAPGCLPTPYGAEAIRAANPPGTTRVFRIEAEGRETRIQTSTFAQAQDGRAAFTSRNALEDGTPDGDPQSGAATWAELQAHASFPASDTTRSEATCTVGAGTFDCRLYERRTTSDGVEEVQRFWFAKELPGPPVLYVQTRDGTPTFRMELIELRRDA